MPSRAIMIALAQRIMIRCVAALAPRSARKGALLPFIPRRFARQQTPARVATLKGG